MAQRTDDENNKLFSMLKKYDKKYKELDNKVDDFEKKLSNEELFSKNMPNINEGYMNILTNLITKNENDIKELRKDIEIIKELYETDNNQQKNID